MRTLLMTLLCLCCTCVFAYDHSYSVSGFDETGGTLQGMIYSNNGDSNVRGDLTDADGNSYSFEGQWVGNGAVSGVTDEGDAVNLRVTQ